jgi:hypothetical protein
MPSRYLLRQGDLGLQPLCQHNPCICCWWWLWLQGRAEAFQHTSESALKGCHSALQAQYDTGKQLARLHARSSGGEVPDMPTDLLKDNGYKQIYQECKRLFVAERGVANPARRDPHDNTEQATFDLDELVQIAKHAVGSEDTRCCRDWSMWSFQSFMAGRGDDTRHRTLPELCEPKYRSCIGEVRP